LPAKVLYLAEQSKIRLRPRRHDDRLSREAIDGLLNPLD